MKLSLVQYFGAISWLLTLPATVDASASASDINRYWTDAGAILNSLDHYQALWVKFHNCVYVTSLMNKMYLLKAMYSKPLTLSRSMITDGVNVPSMTMMMMVKVVMEMKSGTRTVCNISVPTQLTVCTEFPKIGSVFH